MTKLIRAESELAEDLPGPPKFHPKGSKVTLIDTFEYPKLGRIGYVAPDPVGLYIDLAKLYSKKAEIERDILFRDLEKQKPTPSPDGPIYLLEKERTFRFLEYASSVVIFLYTALETFANYEIPENFVYKKKKCFFFSKAYNKKTIERYIPLSIKLNEILTKLKSKEKLKGSSVWEGFVKLCKTRNRLVHLKSKDTLSKDGKISIYADLFLVPSSNFIEAVLKVIDYFGDNSYR